MKNIDFMGTCGVGKTSLFETLLKYRKKKDDWLAPDEASILIAKNMGMWKQKTFLRNLATISLHIPIPFFQRKLVNVLLQKMEHENRFKNLNCYLEMELEYLCNYKKYPTVRNYYRITSLISLIAQLALVLSYPNKQVVLYDESANHRSCDGLYLAGKNNNEIYNFFTKAPKPAGIIYLRDADINNILERVTRDKKKINQIDSKDRILLYQQEGFDKKELKEVLKRTDEIACLATKIFKKRGVPVIEVDVTQPILPQIPRINSFIVAVKNN